MRGIRMARENGSFKGEADMMDACKKFKCSSFAGIG